MQPFQQNNRQYNSEDAIVCPSIRNRIEMRSYQEPRGIRLNACVNSSKISRGIDPHLSTQRLHPSRNF
jgi:hypothetical protein